MGKAPAFFVDDLPSEVQNGLSWKSQDCETAITIRDKTYVIGCGDDESILSIGVRICDKASGKWVIPAVLGTKPGPCKAHSAVSLNEDRILIIKEGCTPDDCIWFLEVDTPYIREQKKILGTDVVAFSKGVRGTAEKPIVISGPSGVGKGTLISMLMKEFPSTFGFSVSHTTRTPRGMEKDGIHYHFTERSVMEKDIKDGRFLEFASVHGNLYGTSIEAVEVVTDAGKRCILDIDVQGARSVRASSLDAIFIFICPPSLEELEKRLRARGTEAEEQILKRLCNAREEIEQGKSSSIFDHILYNDKREECYENLKKILGLEGTTGASQKSPPRGIDLPVNHSISKTHDKIIIRCGTPEPEKEAEKSIVLDLSSIKGGAPRRTRGLRVYDMNSLSGGPNGIDQPS